MTQRYHVVKRVVFGTPGFWVYCVVPEERGIILVENEGLANDIAHALNEEVKRITSTDPQPPKE
jgi:hypothetical protein